MCIGLKVAIGAKLNLNKDQLMTAPISFTGLASGIDTDSIIKQMIDVQQQPIDKLKNKTELLSLQREAMRMSIASF